MSSLVSLRAGIADQMCAPCACLGPPLPSPCPPTPPLFPTATVTTAVAAAAHEVYGAVEECAALVGVVGVAAAAASAVWLLLIVSGASLTMLCCSLQGLLCETLDMLPGLLQDRIGAVNDVGRTNTNRIAVCGVRGMEAGDYEVVDGTVVSADSAVQRVEITVVLKLGPLVDCGAKFLNAGKDAVGCGLLGGGGRHRIRRCSQFCQPRRRPQGSRRPARAGRRRRS